MLITRCMLVLALGLSTKISGTPDFLQTDERAGLANKGSQFCAPTAVSNSLMWLAAHGAPRLAPDVRDPVAAQIALIRALGSSAYMGTRPDIGTDPQELMTGVERWLAHCGVQAARFEYQGWRQVPRRWHASERVDPAALASVITQVKGAVWLNVGWYKRSGGAYHRHSGHWVTLVGVEGDDLLVHDPSPRAGRGPSTERVRMRALDAGTLEGPKGGLPRPARGYFALQGIRSQPGGQDRVILDGAVLLLLR